MSPLLRLTGICKAYGGVRALDAIDFDLRAGEVHALVGENGAGKSTLIKIITGAIQPDAGNLEICGQPILDHDPIRARELGVAVIYQQPALIPDLTVAENLALSDEAKTPWRLIHWSQRRERARVWLDRIGSTIDPDREVGTLTMPEQQLVEIARALGSQAKILIMDEPTASLGQREADRLITTVNDLKSQGVGILYISHRLEELPRLADRVTALRDGCWVGTKPIDQVDRGELITMMVGRQVETIFPKPSVTIGAELLGVSALSCQRSGIRDINFTLRQGEILGLAGLVGAGRTELARTLFGLTPADDGSITLEGREVTITSPRQAIELGIALVPEDRRRHGIIPPMSVLANLSLPRLGHLARLGWIHRDQERNETLSLARQMGVKAPSLQADVGQLSGGNQQKVALGRWIGRHPKILILDEPTQGIDVGAKAEIHRLMGTLVGQGLAILLISSELPEILGMSDRVAIMRSGTIVATLERAEATAEAILDLALDQTEAPAPSDPSSGIQVEARLSP